MIKSSLLKLPFTRYSDSPTDCLVYGLLIGGEVYVNNKRD